MSRREAIQRGLILAAGASLGPVTGLTKPQESSFSIKPRAKSVIQIWLWGGPSHLDTFDPKPEAGADYHGPYSGYVETSVSGMRINEALPELAKEAQKYSLIRGMTHGVNGHETASYLVQTGHQPGRYVHPTFGAVVGLMKGERAGYQGIVPPYVVLTQPQGRFSEAGCMGSRYKPFATGGDPNKTVFTVEGIVAQGISDQRQWDRWKLIDALDTFGRIADRNPNLEKYDAAQSEAFDLMTGDAKKLFDLGLEPERLREDYGRTTFGQECLMARRLVENGVPYVTVNHRGWDTHKNHFQSMQRMLPELDKALATLLRDLDSRGLLESTIVWVGGEFGRTPRVQNDPPWNGGRGHFGRCFTSLVAGGGFAGGQVVGATDARGEEITDRPVYPVDLLGSMYALMGIDTAAELPNPHGAVIPVLPGADVEGVQRAGLLKEILPSV
ncbi:DUF1501 domain-containing protein [Coraliomargarita akajimensis]|nr:DUF1501 domain-containing protein [Coraliomargarita akajimensis]